MHALDHRTRSGCVFAFAAFVLLAAAGGSVQGAQFGLPKLKVPKLPGQKTTATKKKAGAPPCTPTPEITAMNPPSGSPGSSGQVTLTGKNFNDHLRAELKCPQGGARITHFQVTSAEQATMDVSIESSAKEENCSMQFTSHAKAASDETAESEHDTPEVCAMLDTNAKFKIANDGKLPVAYSSRLLGEGDMQFMDLMMKMQKAMMPGFGSDSAEGKLLLADGTLKYVQGEKTVFSEPANGVKDMAEMKQAGQPMGIFRIVFTDGKIYNFMGGGQQQDTHKMFEALKAKLGK
jgi:hypothetical protein